MKYEILVDGDFQYLTIFVFDGSSWIVRRKIILSELDFSLLENAINLIDATNIS